MHLYRHKCVSLFNCVHVFAALWIVAHQAPLFMGLSRQEHWSGLPCPTPGDLSYSGTEPSPLMSPTLTGRFFTTSATWEAYIDIYHMSKYIYIYIYEYLINKVNIKYLFINKLNKYKNTYFYI